MTNAFVLRNIAAVNYYLYAQNFPICSDGNVVFLGANGSGKSVLLDAIQIVMSGMNKSYLDLNTRVAEKKTANRRTVLEACLGALDDGGGYERQSCLTYIALGFETLDGASQCTAGVCIEADAGAGEEAVLGLFVAPDTLLKFEDFTTPAKKGFQEKPWNIFLDEQKRRGIQIKTFPRQKGTSFLRELYAIINANARGTQLDPDRARAALRQALSFNIAQITSVTEFVQRFLLDEAPIDIQIFQERYETWRQMQRDVLRTEEEIATVEKIVAASVRVLKDEYNRHFWEYAGCRANYEIHSRTIIKRSDEIAAMETKIAEIEQDRDNLDHHLESTRRELAAIRRQIEGSSVHAQIDGASREKERAVAARKASVTRASGVYEHLSSLQRLSDVSDFPKQKFQALSAFCNSLNVDAIGRKDDTWPQTPARLRGLIERAPDFQDAVDYFTEEQRQAAFSRGQLEKEVARRDAELELLRKEGRLVHADTRDFLKDLASIGLTAKMISEVADIKPDFAEWRGVVEAILGDWCDAVIVKPRDMDRAYGHFDHAYKGTRAKLVQTERTADGETAALAGSLAEVIETDDAHARAFLNVRLGRIRRAQTASDVRRGDLAASADGKYAHGRGIEYRRPPLYPRLGQAVRERQLEAVREAREKLNAPLTQAIAKEKKVRSQSDALRTAWETLIEKRTELLSLLEDIEHADREISLQDELIKELEAQLPQGLMDRQRELEGSLGEWKKELRDLVSSRDAFIEKRGSTRRALEMAQESREEAASAAAKAIPPFARRRVSFSPPAGLERFMFRVRADYRQALKGSNQAGVKDKAAVQLRDRRNEMQRNATRLETDIRDYVLTDPALHPGIDWSEAIADEKTVFLYHWAHQRLEFLQQKVLREYKEKIGDAVKAMVDVMVQDFLSRLEGHINSVERTMETLNRALRRSVFMGEIYKIRLTRDPDKETIRYLIDRLDEVAAKATALMQSDPDMTDPDQVKIKELIDMLITENVEDEAAHCRRLRELSDYRNYFRFRIDICDPEDNDKKISDLDTRQQKGSGGQVYLPYYICLGVAANAAYRNHLGGSADAPPQSALLLMDEAFEKLDPENIYKIVAFYKSLGLQLIMAAPKTHQALYQETFDTLISIVRQGRRISAVAQHFSAAARQMIRDENPMHRPREYFEKLYNERRDAAE